MEISKVLTISTAHITEDTATKLRNSADINEMQLTVYEKAEYGWWIFISDDLDEFFNNGENIPQELWECMRFAASCECNWLCLDCDGEELNELQKFEW